MSHDFITLTIQRIYKDLIEAEKDRSQANTFSTIAILLSMLALLLEFIVIAIKIAGR